MKNNWVITIGREFCSGGAETAHKLSKLLDIPYYDKEIIDEAVKTTQLAEDEFTQFGITCGRAGRESRVSEIGRAHV